MLLVGRSVAWIMTLITAAKETSSVHDQAGIKVNLKKVCTVKPLSNEAGLVSAVCWINVIQVSMVCLAATDWKHVVSWDILIAL